MYNIKSMLYICIAVQLCRPTTQQKDKQKRSIVNRHTGFPMALCSFNTSRMNSTWSSMSRCGPNAFFSKRKCTSSASLGWMLCQHSFNILGLTSTPARASSALLISNLVRTSTSARHLLFSRSMIKMRTRQSSFFSYVIFSEN